MRFIAALKGELCIVLLIFKNEYAAQRKVIQPRGGCILKFGTYVMEVETAIPFSSVVQYCKS